jgi:LPS export ABC transporter protein LptC
MIKQLFFYKILRAAAFIAGCFFLFACENDMNEVAGLNKKTIAVEEARQIQTFYSQEGRMKAKLISPLMLHYQTDSPYFEFPKTLHVDFFNTDKQDGKVESVLNARYGRYKQNENKVFLKDSVQVYNLTGDTLYCDELWWDQQLQKFYTDKPVRIHQKDKIIFGKGMEAGQDFSWWTIFQSNGTVNVPANKLQ